MNLRSVTCVAPLGLLLALSSALFGCDKHEPVAESECPTVVAHSRKLLGDRADPYAKAMETCKAADDQARGCAMAAGSAADLLRCSM